MRDAISSIERPGFAGPRSTTEHCGAPIELAALAFVTGGRQTHSPNQVDPVLAQGIQALAQAVQGMGQNLAQAKTDGSQQTMQMMQQMMQAKAGH
ncbi:MAG TPA: hypothetical protein VGF94_18555 [Kofleriaceae bacterium]|jgi:hypothetical protein